MALKTEILLDMHLTIPIVLLMISVVEEKVPQPLLEKILEAVKVLKVQSSTINMRFPILEEEIRLQPETFQLKISEEEMELALLQVANFILRILVVELQIRVIYI